MDGLMTDKRGTQLRPASRRTMERHFLRTWRYVFILNRNWLLEGVHAGLLGYSFGFDLSQLLHRELMVFVVYAFGVLVDLKLADDGCIQIEIVFRKIKGPVTNLGASKTIVEVSKAVTQILQLFQLIPRHTAPKDVARKLPSGCSGQSGDRGGENVNKNTIKVGAYLHLLFILLWF